MSVTHTYNKATDTGYLIRVTGAPNFFSGWNVTSSGSGVTGQIDSKDGVSVLLTFNDTEKLGDSKISHRMFTYLVNPVIDWVNKGEPKTVSFAIDLTKEVCIEDNDPESPAFGEIVCTVNDYTAEHGFFESEDDEQNNITITDRLTFIYEDTQILAGLTLQEALNGVTHEYTTPGKYFTQVFLN